MNNALLKKNHRQEVLVQRDNIPIELRIEKSIQLCDHAVQSLNLMDYPIVSGFSPIRSEVDIRPLMAAFADKGARLCLPIIIDKTTIIFRELTSDTKLEDCGFGTVGPGKNAAILEPDLMFVPLAAFDKTGQRIGYGAGYYDRAISKFHQTGHKPKLVGIAYSMQEINSVPHEDHDIPLDAILTENGLRYFS